LLYVRIVVNYVKIGYLFSDISLTKAINKSTAKSEEKLFMVIKGGF